MCTQGQHAAAGGGDRARRVDRIQPLQQVAACRQRAGRRRIDEAQRGIPPGRQFQRQRRQVQLGDLGATLWLQALRLRP